MPKPKKAQPIGGPHLAVAVFCERVIVEKDSAISIMRIIDVLTVKKPPELITAPDGKPVAPAVPVWMAVVFKSGDATGEHKIRLDAVFPSGKVVRGNDQLVSLLGGGNGATLYGEIPVDVSEEGLYWYGVFMDGERVTRMPLQIIYQKPPLPGQLVESATAERDSLTGDSSPQSSPPADSSAAGRKKPQRR